MTNNPATRTGRYMHLVDVLSNASMVRRTAQIEGVADPKEIASEAADGLLDIESAATVLFTDLVPRLEALSPLSPEFEGLLGEIAEEYRHIYYHIVNTRLFGYVITKR